MTPEYRVDISLKHTAPSYLVEAENETKAALKAWDLFDEDLSDGEAVVTEVKPESVRKTKQGKVNWIIETKGRVWESIAAKDEAMRNWCERVSGATGAAWHYIRVDQLAFDHQHGHLLSDLVEKEAAPSLFKA